MDFFSSHSALIGELASLGAPRLAVRDLFEKLVATLKLPQAARVLRAAARTRVGLQGYRSDMAFYPSERKPNEATQYEVTCVPRITLVGPDSRTPPSPPDGRAGVSVRAVRQNCAVLFPGLPGTPSN